MRRISPLTLLFFLVSCNSAAQEQVVAEASDTVPSAKVTLLFVGDLMQHKAQLKLRVQVRGLMITLFVSLL